MNDKKKKRFIKPEADVVEFHNDDIITDSGLTLGGTAEWGTGGGDWLEEQL